MMMRMVMMIIMMMMIHLRQSQRNSKEDHRILRPNLYVILWACGHLIGSCSLWLLDCSLITVLLSFCQRYLILDWFHFIGFIVIGLVTLLVLVSSHWRHLIWLIWLNCFDLNWFYINIGFDCDWLITLLVLVSSHWRHLTHNLTLHGLCIGSPT